MVTLSSFSFKSASSFTILAWAPASSVWRKFILAWSGVIGGDTFDFFFDLEGLEAAAVGAGIDGIDIKSLDPPGWFVACPGVLAEIVGDVVEIMGLEAEHDGMLTILDCENVGVVTTGVDDEVAGDVGKGCKEWAIVVDVDPCSGDWMDDWGEELFVGTNVKTRCQLKWRMQRQNHQFWKCYIFHI